MSVNNGRSKWKIFLPSPKLLTITEIHYTFRMMMNRVEAAKKKRRVANDKFREENGYSWDYVMAFAVYDENEPITEFQRIFSLKYVLHRLGAGGLTIRIFYSIKHNEVFVKIRAPIDRLLKEGESAHFHTH